MTGTVDSDSDRLADYASVRHLSGVGYYISAKRPNETTVFYLDKNSDWCKSCTEDNYWHTKYEAELVVKALPLHPKHQKI